ncbi:peptidylprolyl isomerase [Muribaculum caecicola]|uniref:Peptidylprolyl isomerase n=1 Tax=Muribaculum caecicola TaxID=3038144 RepID=A0AC61S5D3_9BACT|nr:peptidylprolyl isomerase [Muribaculum caecicola]THG51458.1 peptidylprolyl isomerase [Muribaculum caecicola]
MTAAITLAATAQNNIVEEVAWWIGDQPIYKSEVEEAYQNLLFERQDINGDPYCIIPERLAMERLFLHQAELDSIDIPQAQVTMMVDQQINYLTNNLGSKEKVEEFYRRPLPEIRTLLRELITNRQKVEQVQNSLTQDFKSTPSDVRKYFQTLPEDSIPFVPMQVEVQIMTLNPVIPREEIDEVKARLRDFTDRVNKGESEFSTLAILYSEDPGSGMRGGEIGFMSKANLDPEYAAVAFNLNDPKRVSKIVESQYGFHIIQLIEKRGDRINTRHILLKPKVAEKDLTEAMNRLDTIRQEMLAEKYTFEEAVYYVSQDKDTRNNKGVMVNEENQSNRFEMAQLPQEVSRVVSTMSVGEISKPFIMSDAKHNREVVAMIKLSNRIDGHRANLSDDYQRILAMYEESAKEKIVDDWLLKKIKDTYVRIEDGWRNCEFKHEGWIKTAKQ